MEELLGILSILSSLLVLALIWSTARPIRRTSRRAWYGVYGSEAAFVQRRRTEAVRPVHAGRTEVGSEEVKAEAVKVDEPVKGADGAAEGRAEEQREPQEESAGSQEGYVGEAPSQEGVPGADLEEEVFRELSETLSMYRQLLEELRRLRSGGSPE
jgi:hypothetical protein